MSKLNVDQKPIYYLFCERKTDFLIPDYQRPYAWEERECQILWDDLFTFAFPDNDSDKFNPDHDEYFLGPIVTFKNSNGKHEVIDGQQRLTTLMLLLRAFYKRYGSMKTENAIKTAKEIEKCIWKTDELGDADKTALKINSEVATDDDKHEFLDILNNGEAPDSMKSRYAENYRFFEGKIQKFTEDYPDYFSFLPIRIMNNCILLPIEAESQETALRIFGTLNNRGKPLSDSDIFKAQLYKFYSNLGKKDDFVTKWKELEKIANDIYRQNSGSAMDETFTRYMYYERAKKGIKNSTTEALRKFYENDSYILLKNEEIFENIIDLTNFWNDVEKQNADKFTEEVLRKLFVLRHAPNGMWTYFLSVYYMANRSKDGLLEQNNFYKFLCKIIGFIWTYTITNPGVNSLRTPVYSEMVNIVNHLDVDFKEFKFEENKIKELLNSFSFVNSKAITKSMLTWWAFQDDTQKLLSISEVFEIEHIFAKNRQDNERTLKDPNNLECLGNKALLEKRINIRASDYRFQDKKKYYTGFTTSKNTIKEGTKIQELIDISNKSDFVENDIIERNNIIINAFVNYLRENDLLQ